MKRIALTVWMGMTVRNILYGPVIERLGEEYEVTIISNYGSLLQKVLNVSRLNLKFQKLQISRWQLPVIQGWLTGWVYEWNYFAFWLEKKPRSISITVQWEKENRPIRYFFNTIGANVVRKLRHSKADTDALRNIAYFLPVKKQFKDIDAVVVSSTDIPKDQMLTYSCKKAGIPVICVVHSWDNLPARGLLAAIPDRLLVWNRYMAEEAVNLHGVAPERIDIVGVPQYESYRRIAKRTNENTFRERLNISNNATIITFTTSVDWVYPDEVELLEKLLTEINEGRFGDAVLVVRLHPTDERTSLYIGRYSNSKLPIRLDRADSAFAAMNTGKIGELGSVIKFVELMQFSDIVLNVASTVSLDAILFNTLVVCPNFSFTVAAGAWNSVDELYRSSHFSRVTDSGAVSLPKSMDEMLEDINIAIRNPEERQKERDLLSAVMMPNLPTSLLIHQSIKFAIEGKQSAPFNDLQRPVDLS